VSGYGEVVQELWERARGEWDTNISLLTGPWARPSDIRSYIEGGELALWRDLVEWSRSLPPGYIKFLESLEAMNLPGYELIGGAKGICYKTKTRLIVGSGLTGWETVIPQLLMPFGVPWIPGSSLKGVMEATALSRLEEKIRRGEVSLEDLVEAGEQARGKLVGLLSNGLHNYKELKLGQLKGELRKIGVLFGTKECKGSLIVLGGFIKQVPENGFLTADVITPHYKEYYEGGEKWPHEHLNPVPIKFPAVREGTTFVFILFVKKEHMDYAEEILHDTLTKTGIGGKTSAGYGIFDRV